MISRLLRNLGLAPLVLAGTVAAVHAQPWPPGPGTPPTQSQQSPACTRLEAQLAAVDRGTTDPGRAEQIKRYEEAASRQQAELDRTVTQSRRAGCEGSGFFLFGSQSPQCGELNAQIQRMRMNLDRVTTDLQRLQGSNVDRGEQRRTVLTALAENNCGPQYRTATRQRGLFEQLFGPAVTTNTSITADPSNPDTASGSYRTLCVRTCDGFYFPISNATNPTRFPNDEKTCQRLCPAAEVVLYSHRNPGEEVAQATSINGRPYSELPNAYRYRTEFNAACTCKRPGQSWSEALGGRDETVESGDIVVTEDRAKLLAQPPRANQSRPQAKDTRPGRPDPKNPNQNPNQNPSQNPSPAVPPAEPPAQVATPEATSAEPGKRTVRSVGPTFYPVR